MVGGFGMAVALPVLKIPIEYRKAYLYFNGRIRKTVS
jgi:hypothetical protein